MFCVLNRKSSWITEGFFNHKANGRMNTKNIACQENFQRQKPYDDLGKKCLLTHMTEQGLTL